MIEIASHRLLGLGVGESQASVLSRIAMEVGLTPFEFCTELRTTVPAVLDGVPDALNRLAEACQIDPIALAENSLIRTGKRLYQYRGIDVRQPNFERTVMRVCPLCVREDVATGWGRIVTRPFMRTLWHASSIGPCPSHNVELVLGSHETRWTKVNDTATRMRGIIERLDTLPVRELVPTRAERYLLGRFEGTPDDTWLGSQSYHAATKLFEYVGTMERHGVDGSWLALTTDQKRDAFQAGYEILRRGSEHFDEWLGSYTSAFFRGRAAWSGQLFYGRLYIWLRSNIADVELDGAREVVRNHMLDRLPLGPEDRIFDRPVLRRKFHTPNSLSLARNIPITSIRRVGAFDKVLVDDPELSDDRVLMDFDDGEALADRIVAMYETSAAMAPGADDVPGKKRKAKTGLSLQDVRRRMHLMRGQELYILNSGYLKPRPSPVAGQYSFEVAEVDALMDRIMSRVIVPMPTGLVPLANAYRRAGCSIVQIFPLLMEGKLTRIGMAKGKAGITGLLVCSDEVKRLLPRPPAKGLTKQQVEKALRTTSRVVNRLLDHGHLPHFVERHGTVSQRKVSEADLKAFMTQYVSTYRLSQEWNFGALGVQRRLADLGVRPAFDKGQIKASFYHRADVPDRLPT